jgi:dolichyl-phosphate beta-glucosyltransferase
MADQRAALGLVVPVFDEAARLADYVKLLADFAAALPAGSEVLFVDDGSTDGTPELIEDLLVEVPGSPTRVLRRPHTGKGGAITAGLRDLRTPLRGFCDLDLSTPLEDLTRIATVAERVGALAIGSRDLATSTLVEAEGPLRETLGRAYNRLLQVVATPGVVDTQCGAKVAPAAVWDAVLDHCQEVGFAWDAEAIAVARAVGVEVVEVPVWWRHDERSKIKLGRDGAAMLAAIPRIRRTARRAAASATRPAAPLRALVGDGHDEGTASSRERAGVFDDANAELLAGSDGSHWWFRSKAALVSTALSRSAPQGRVGGSPAADGSDSEDDRGFGRLVDLGAGAGAVTAMLGWSPDRAVVVEGNRLLATEARRRHGLGSVRGTVHAVPLADGSADVVCLLDVIEHLDDPVAALREAVRLLAPGGRVVVNVPAHRWLWSAADEALGHVRRYTRPDLRAELAAAGLEPVLLSHVFSWLVPPVWLTRRVVSTDEPELGLERTSAVIDGAAMALTFAERMLLDRVALPFGTSLLCVATRPDGVATRRLGRGRRAGRP